jgi:hypothetical protein
MIDSVNNLLRHMMLSQITELADETQVRFQPPDEGWRNHVSTLQGNALNIYLVDLRENRKLRSNERVRSFENGVVNEDPAPARVDLHYLITAWSPAEPGPALEPTLDEHALLYEVTGVLMNNVPLIPRQIYEPDPLPLNFPELIADAELPVSILPVEGFPKYGEFWGTMGVNHRWKPAVYLIVTLPVVLPREVAGPMVTDADYRIPHADRPTRHRRCVDSDRRACAGCDGGIHLYHLYQLWMPGCSWKTWITERIQTTRTNELGRFTFGELQQGQYRLRYSAAGLERSNERYHCTFADRRI